MYVNTNSTIVAGAINLKFNKNKILYNQNEGNNLQITYEKKCDTALYLYNTNKHRLLILYKDSPCLSIDSNNYTIALMVFDSAMVLQKYLIFSTSIIEYQYDESSDVLVHLYRWTSTEVESSTLHVLSKFLFHYDIEELFSSIEDFSSNKVKILSGWHASPICSNSIVKRLCTYCH